MPKEFYEGVVSGGKPVSSVTRMAIERAYHNRARLAPWEIHPDEEAIHHYMRAMKGKVGSEDGSDYEEVVGENQVTETIPGAPAMQFIPPEMVPKPVAPSSRRKVVFAKPGPTVIKRTFVRKAAPPKGKKAAETPVAAGASSGPSA